MARANPFNTYAPGSRGPLEVLDGSTWRRVPKIRNVGFTPTTPSEATTEYVDEPTETRAGQSGPGNVTYDLTRAPTMRAYRVARDAFKTGTILRFRDWGGAPVAEASGTDQLAVTTGGVGTLSGTGASAGSADAPTAKYRPGRIVFPTGAAVDDQVLTIESVTGATGLMLTRLGTITTAAAAGQPAIVTEDSEDITVVANAAFRLSSPGTLREFEGRVTSLGGYTRGANNEGQVDQLVINVLEFPTEMLVAQPATT